MIAFLEGELVEKNPAYVIIKCNGVGYMAHISLHTYSLLPPSGQVKLFTELIVREDAHTLFGFISQEEKSMFKHLISVSGVGPNTARVILSSLSVSEIKEAIVGNNASVLQSVKGIGSKSAQRIVLDLKDKLEKQGITTGENIIPKSNTLREEALSALVMLGYNKAVAQKTIHQVLKSNPNAGLSVEQLIKESLKYS
ncbi:MAG: Holliday junction branch migration protein RuvA [Bacteroidota bacterium]